MKILIIDNNIHSEFWGSKELCKLAKLHPKATVYIRRAPEEDLPKDPAPYDRIIVSGSKTSAMSEEPWIEKLSLFIKRAVDLKKPYLGVCYGHQMLARALGGKDCVRKAAQPEIGWVQVKLTGSSPLLEGLPKEFYTYSSHYDEVCTLPKGMKNLAHSDICAVQACQLESSPVFGIQFHPERTLEDANRSYQQLIKTSNPPVFLNYARGVKLYNSKIGETLFKNFLSL